MIENLQICEPSPEVAEWAEAAAEFIALEMADEVPMAECLDLPVAVLMLLPRALPALLAPTRLAPTLLTALAPPTRDGFALLTAESSVEPMPDPLMLLRPPAPETALDSDDVMLLAPPPIAEAPEAILRPPARLRAEAPLTAESRVEPTADDPPPPPPICEPAVLPAADEPAAPLT